MPTSKADGSVRPSANLVISDLSAGYGKTPVVHEVSLSVGRGEIVAVLGPNGAGKSTILKALTGFAALQSGSISIDGQDITRAAPHTLASKGIGYIPQTRDVFEGLTVKENLEMGGYLLPKAAIVSRIEEVLVIFPALAPMLGRAARKLSGGERKMTAVARVMMTRPTLMLLDEPTASLAPALAHRLLEEQITAVARAGAAVLLVEQKAASALAVSDWAYLLVAGRVVRSGDPGTLRSQPDFAATFLGGASSSLRAS
jgi:ABC-type branched-subunit amino acid transport system ATPase component